MSLNVSQGVVYHVGQTDPPVRLRLSYDRDATMFQRRFAKNLRFDSSSLGGGYYENVNGPRGSLMGVEALRQSFSDLVFDYTTLELLVYGFVTRNMGPKKHDLPNYSHILQMNPPPYNPPPK